MKYAPVAVLILFCYLPGGVTCANEAPESIRSFGGTICPLPGQHPRVAVQRQFFWFNLDKDRVEADYALQSVGMARRLTFCVPQYWAVPNSDGSHRYDIESLHLRVWVDGTRVRPVRRSFRPARVSADAYDLPDGLAPSALWIVHVPMRRRQTRHVRVTFISVGSGHESILWLLFFPRSSWPGRVPVTNLKVSSKHLGLGDAEIRLFSSGLWTMDYKDVPARHRGDSLLYSWKNWKPTGFLMPVVDR